MAMEVSLSPKMHCDFLKKKKLRDHQCNIQTGKSG